MSTFLKLSACLLAAALSGHVTAQTPVKVESAWARATVQGQKATGAFMKLTAPQATRLVAVTTPVAGVAEIHEMVTTYATDDTKAVWADLLAEAASVPRGEGWAPTWALPISQATS